MRKDYLLKAIDALEKPMPKNLNFNMRWYLREEKGNKIKNCGCIIGLLITKIFFKKLGLKFVTDKTQPQWIEYGTGFHPEGKGSFRCNAIIFKKKHNVYAIMKLFELSYDQCLYIFGAARLGTRKDAIKRIKLVVSEKWKKADAPGVPVTMKGEE